MENPTLTPLERSMLVEEAYNRIPIASQAPATKNERLEDHIATRDDGTEWVEDEKGNWKQVEQDPDVYETDLRKDYTKMVIDGMKAGSAPGEPLDFKKIKERVDMLMGKEQDFPKIPDGPSSPWPRQQGKARQSGRGTTFALDESQGPNGFTPVQ